MNRVSSGFNVKYCRIYWTLLFQNIGHKVKFLSTPHPFTRQIDICYQVLEISESAAQTKTCTKFNQKEIENRSSQ